jgi:hypothetical protein
MLRFIRVRLDPRISGGHPRILPGSRAYFSGSAAATRRAAPQTAATGIERLGPPLLDEPAADMGAMV